MHRYVQEYTIVIKNLNNTKYTNVNTEQISRNKTNFKIISRNIRFISVNY